MKNVKNILCSFSALGIFFINSLYAGFQEEKKDFDSDLLFREEKFFLMSGEEIKEEKLICSDYEICLERKKDSIVIKVQSKEEIPRDTARFIVNKELFYEGEANQTILPNDPSIFLLDLVRGDVNNILIRNRLDMLRVQFDQFRDRFIEEFGESTFIDLFSSFILDDGEVYCEREIQKARKFLKQKFSLKSKTLRIQLKEINRNMNKLSSIYIVMPNMPSNKIRELEKIWEFFYCFSSEFGLFSYHYLSDCQIYDIGDKLFWSGIQLIFKNKEGEIVRPYLKNQKTSIIFYFKDDEYFSIDSAKLYTKRKYKNFRVTKLANNIENSNGLDLKDIFEIKFLTDCC